MENKLKVSPVMLPTSTLDINKGDLLFDAYMGKNYISIASSDFIGSKYGFHSQHLYLVSDDSINRPIKEGDWCYYKHWENNKEFISKVTKDVFRLQVEKR